MSVDSVSSNREPNELKPADEDPAQDAESLAKIAGRWPDRVGATRRYARLLMKQFRYEDALPVWERVAKKVPAEVEPHMALSRIHWRMQRPLDALRRLNTVLQIKPAHDEALSLRAVIVNAQLATLWERMGEVDAQAVTRQIADLEQILGSDPLLKRLKALVLNGKVARPEQRAEISAEWRDENCRDDLKARLDAIRMLEYAGGQEQLVAETLSVLRDFAPFESLDEAAQILIVEIVRRLRSGVARSNRILDLSALAATVRERSGEGPLARWILGMLCLAQSDGSAALSHFESARLGGGNQLPLDLDAEIADLHARFHRFGEARASARRLTRNIRLDRGYRTRNDLVEKVADFCGASDDLRYPECLIDVILAECADGPIGYEPESGCLLTVVSSLGQGGSERQTVAVAKKMACDGRIGKLALAVHALERDEHKFFLGAVQGLPVELFAYGGAWKRRSDILLEIPGLAGRDRLITVIEMLPHNQREEIIRLCKLILKKRPRAVHLRQDLFSGALACAIAGVPKYLVHRGTLSPDHWELNELQTNVHIRPMRHTYRRLLERPNFLIVNNSAAGAASDRMWLDWSDATRFKVVYNAIEFDKLGADPPRNPHLRSQLGIGQRDFVIGGAFRIEAVKRPLLWIEIASAVAQAIPSAHFVILGDGSMTEAVQSYAQARGLSGRLHMPGRVSDVGEWFRIMDVNLLTSEREGLPNVLIEGQHFGVPAIASDVGGARETLEPGITGHLIAANASAETFAEAVVNILNSAEWRARARARAPVFVHTKFSAKNSVDQLLTHLELAPVERKRELDPLRATNVPGYVVEPFPLPAVNPRHCENIFGDLHSTIDRHIAALGTGSNPHRKSFRDFLLYLREVVPAPGFAALQRKWLKPGSLDPGEQAVLKFFDIIYWCQGKFGIAQRLGLDRSPPARIVDIGAGPAHFSCVAGYFGHHVLGTDLEPGPGRPRALEMYADFRDLLSAAWIPHATTVGEPLPTLPHGIDICTAFLTKFHAHPDGTPWTVEDWREFLRRLAPSFSGDTRRLSLKLNRELITPAVWEFLSRIADFSAPEALYVDIGAKYPDAV